MLLLLFLSDFSFAEHIKLQYFFDCNVEQGCVVVKKRSKGIPRNFIGTTNTK